MYLQIFLSHIFTFKLLAIFFWRVVIKISKIVDIIGILDFYILKLNINSNFKLFDLQYFHIFLVNFWINRQMLSNFIFMKVLNYILYSSPLWKKILGTHVLSTYRKFAYFTHNHWRTVWDIKFFPENFQT